MKNQSIKKHSLPSTQSLREMPEIEFSRFRVRKNRFAKRIAAQGIEVMHEGPSRSSLKAIPEADFSRQKVRRNPYAKRIAATGIVLQVGRGRPERGGEVGPTVTKSVRLPPALWVELEKRARAEGVAVHALIRHAIVDLIRRVA